MSEVDDTEAAALGGNAKAELKRRVERRVELLDQVAEIQEELKALKAADKADGFTEKAIADAVKLRRADADQVLARLMLEAEIDIYREAAGVATSIEAAQERAREQAQAMPEPKPKAARPGKRRKEVE